MMNTTLVETCNSFNSLSLNISCLKQQDCEPDTEGHCCSKELKDSCRSLCTTKVAKNGFPRFRIDDCLAYANVSQYLEPLPSNNTVLLSAFPVSSPWNESVGLSEGLARCMVDLCQLSPTCRTGLVSTCTFDVLMPDKYTVSADAVYGCRSEICPSTVLNSDVAGVGITLSYMFQVAIAYLLSFTLLILSLYKSRCRKRIERAELTRIIGTPLEGDLNQQAERARLARYEEKFEIVIKTTGSFHAAQCFFCLAQSIATVVFLIPGKTELNDLDQQALVVISGLGVYPVTFLLCLTTIFRPESVSWFNLSVSLVSWTLSLTVARNVLDAVPNYRILRQSPGDQCFGITVSQFCQRDFRLVTPNVYLMFVPAMMWIILVRIGPGAQELYENLIQWLERRKSVGGTRLRQTHSKQHAMQVVTLLATSIVRWDTDAIASHAMPNTNPFKGRYSFLLLKTIPLVLLIGPLFAMGGISLWWFGSGSAKESMKMVNREWTFGQIVALTMWLPIIAEFLVLCWESRKKNAKRKRKGKETGFAESKSNFSTDTLSDTSYEKVAMMSKSSSFTINDSSDGYPKRVS